MLLVDSKHSVSSLLKCIIQMDFHVLTINFSVVNCGSSNQISVSNQPLISGGIPAHGTSAVVSQPQ